MVATPDKPQVEETPLSPEELRKIHAYWRACNYLAVGMIYLKENPLLKETLTEDHVKNRLLGHWGSSPGLSFIYIHLNRLIKKYDFRCCLHGRTRSRCARNFRASLFRRNLLRSLPRKKRR